jgi:hypothetical protein
MKFPSLSSLVQRAAQTLLRFPLAILLAVAGTVVFITMVHLGARSEEVIFTRCSNAVISCYLGMLLSIAMTVWTERRGWRLTKALGLQAAILVLTVVYYSLMPDDFDKKMVIRWFLYALGLHLLIAVIGFLGGEHINSFWQYNKKLFLRILTSLLYTGVLYLGLCLALLAIEHLFYADLSYKWYADTGLLLIGIFNTWFFLSGFPDEYGDVPVIDDYPKGLKIFTQYVLLPILSIYMVILYAYFFKIVFTAHWPTGWVAYLVLGFSIAGILALLLIYPLRNDEGNKWINGYSRFFYFALLPLLVLLGFAIWKRVAAYGITESRYYVLLLAAWLLCVAVYFLRSRIKNIRVIPFSLCILAFLSSFGPWSVFNVSRYSQQARLKSYLLKYGLFKDGQVTGIQAVVPRKDREEISSMTDYIVETHGYQPLQPLFRQNLDSMMRKDSLMGKYSQRERAVALMKLMHLPYTSKWDQDEESQSFNCRMEPVDTVFATDGLSYLIPDLSLVEISDYDATFSRYQLGKDSLIVFLDSARNQVHFLPGIGSKDSAVAIGLDKLLEDTTMELEYTMTLSPEKSTLPFHTSHWTGKLVVTTFSGTQRNKIKHIQRLEGHLLIRREEGR